MRALFEKGDWSAIERYASVQPPLFSVAWSTLKGYESCWKHWVSFQYRAQLPIFMRVGTAFERSLSSKWMLSFIAVLGFACGYAPSTIKKCLMAIRFFHLAHDHENPLEKCPRVWQGYKSIKRIAGPTVRKFPITPEEGLPYPASTPSGASPKSAKGASVALAALARRKTRAQTAARMGGLCFPGYRLRRACAVAPAILL